MVVKASRREPVWPASGLLANSDVRAKATAAYRPRPPTSTITAAPGRNGTRQPNGVPSRVKLTPNSSAGTSRLRKAEIPTIDAAPWAPAYSESSSSVAGAVAVGSVDAALGAAAG